MKKNNIKRVILIIADTLRAQNVGLFGANPSPTPNIDALGKNGVVFTNAYTTITKTDPSITAIMSGLYPVSSGLINHGRNLKPEELEMIKNIPLLPEVLRQHGFYTAAIDWLGRWHKRGFSYYSGKLIKDNPSLNLALDNLPIFFYLRVIDKVAIKYLKRDFLLRFYYSFFPNLIVPYDPADVVIKEAIKILEKKEKEEIFLYLHFWDTHEPYTKSKGLKSYLLNSVGDNYNDEVRFLDSALGELFKYLNTTRQMNNTLLIITADHGETFSGRHRPFTHEGLYDDVAKIPLIIWHNSLPSKRVESLVQSTDIMPTILDLLKIPPLSDIDGRSLLPLILNKNGWIRNFAYFEDIKLRRLRFGRNLTRRRGLRIGNFKYIQTLVGEAKKINKAVPSEDLNIVYQELYDSKNDPLEKENLFGKRPIVAKRMKASLRNIVLLLNKRRLQNNSTLYSKVEKSLRVIKKTANQFKDNKVAIAWTGGKDSTVLLHLVRIAFDGKIPFKVIFNDSTMEFEEIYEFIDRISKLWNIEVITIKHSEKELREFNATKNKEKRKELSRLMKISAINSALKKYKLKAFIVAIRWDEHKSRSKEKYFSPRPNHMRIHPILHFTEKDIWEYINYFGVPYVELYDKGYRSLGEKPFTKPVPPGGKERSGREREKEELMERLRKLGYW